MAQPSDMLNSFFFFYTEIYLMLRAMNSVFPSEYLLLVQDNNLQQNFSHAKDILR